MHPFRRLSVWRKGHELVLRVHAASAPIHGSGNFALANQLRRAAISIPANIAEGTGGATPAQFATFLQVAIGSSRELDYHLLLARDLGYLTSSEHAMLEARTDEVARMLVSLRKTVVKRALTPAPPPKSRARSKESPQGTK